MSFDDDFLGGLFDFDGDGKTSLEEEFLAYCLFEEECRNREKLKKEKEKDYFVDIYTPPVRENQKPPVRENRPQLPVTPLTKENYPKKKREIKFCIVNYIFWGIFLSLFPALLICAAFQTYTPGAASATVVICGGSLIFFCLLWSAVASSIKASLGSLKILEFNYRNLLSESEREKSEKEEKGTETEE